MYVRSFPCLCQGAIDLQQGHSSFPTLALSPEGTINIGRGGLDRNGPVHRSMAFDLDGVSPLRMG
ncbi:hypothetical protein [Pasteuria penetrans]|uniref:hypothetical protein n=1 Tax=Pasteuria penetrans TaxID=86005 RepID=UPI0011F040BE|nr:hypothetical protein [Pasteuria penetrans]